MSFLEAPSHDCSDPYHGGMGRYLLRGGQRLRPANGQLRSPLAVLDRAPSLCATGSGPRQVAEASWSPTSHRLERTLLSDFSGLHATWAENPAMERTLFLIGHRSAESAQEKHQPIGKEHSYQTAPGVLAYDPLAPSATVIEPVWASSRRRSMSLSARFSLSASRPPIWSLRRRSASGVPVWRSQALMVLT